MGIETHELFVTGYDRIFEGIGWGSILRSQPEICTVGDNIITEFEISQVRTEPDGRFIRSVDDRVRDGETCNGMEEQQGILTLIENTMVDMDIGAMGPDGSLYGSGILFPDKIALGDVQSGGLLTFPVDGIVVVDGRVGIAEELDAMDGYVIFGDGQSGAVRELSGRVVGGDGTDHGHFGWCPARVVGKADGFDGILAIVIGCIGGRGADDGAVPKGVESGI